MDDLRKYVDHLFCNYKSNTNINDLKAEILSNLEAKRDDLIAGGLTRDAAVQQAIESINTIDHLVEDNHNIRIHQFQLESLQSLLLYLLTVWIAAMPFTIWNQSVISMNLILLIAILFTGIIYLVMRSNKHTNYLNAQQYVNMRHYNKMRKIVWTIWGLYMTAQVLLTTVMYFGTDLWFSRPLQIDGPYQFAQIISGYITPFATIVIPLITNKLPKLILKYEVAHEV